VKADEGLVEEDSSSTETDLDETIIEEDQLDKSRSAVGAELVNFARRCVKPWTTFDLSAGADLFRDERVAVSAQFDIENLFDRRFVYNFGNPFSGTHFGHPRMLSGRVRLIFH
jgi:outer membrane receptor for Fe3+-dicitrate